MKTRRFATRTDAERFLITQGFRFQGAPNRWRKQTGTRVLHAEIVERDLGAVVVIVDSAEEAPP